VRRSPDCCCDPSDLAARYSHSMRHTTPESCRSRLVVRARRAVDRIMEPDRGRYEALRGPVLGDASMQLPKVLKVPESVYRRPGARLFAEDLMHDAGWQPRRGTQVIKSDVQAPREYQGLPTSAAIRRLANVDCDRG
jgi:hypothetical protein